MIRATQKPWSFPFDAIMSYANFHHWGTRSGDTFQRAARDPVLTEILGGFAQARAKDKARVDKV